MDERSHTGRVLPVPVTATEAARKAATAGSLAKRWRERLSTFGLLLFIIATPIYAAFMVQPGSP